MSDVVVSTTEPVTTVTTVDDVVQVAVTNNVVEVSASTAGVQGASYSKGDPIYVTVRNATGATLAKGTIVYISGSNGNHVQVTPAIATSDATSARTLGWLSESIANNASGLCQVEGYLEGLDTQGLTSGSQLYLSGTVAGAFQVTKPQAPIHLVYVGVVTKISAGDGHVFVKVQNGYELDEIHDVRITDPVNNQVLTYDSATDLWVNATNPADGVTSITAVSPLTGGTITSTGSIGLDQTALSITQSQVSNLVTDLANTAKLNTANTFSVGGHVINNNATGTVPLAVRAFAGQNVNSLEVRNNANSPVFSVFHTGTAFFGPTQTVSGSFISGISGRAFFNTTDPATNALLVAGATSQTADIFRIQNSSAVDLSYVTASGDMWVTGAVRSLFYTNKNNTGGYLNYSSNSPMFEQRIASEIALRIRGAASQSAHLLQVQDSSGTVLSGISASGRIYTGTAPLTNAGAQSANISALADAATVTPLIVRGAASQSADLFEVQNSSLVDLFSVSSAGLITAKVVGNAANQSRGLLLSNTADTWQSGLYLRSDASGFPRLSLLAPTGALGEAVSIDSAAKVGIGNVAPVAQLDVYSQSSTRVGQVIRGAASQTADLLLLQNSASATQFRVDPNGMTIVNSLGVAGSPNTISYAYFTTPNAALKPVVVRSAASQTANVFETQDVSGTTRFYVDAAHNANFSSASWIQNSTGKLTVGLSSASAVGVTVKGAASQTANLTEWQSSAGSILSAIDSSGNANLLRGNFRGAVYATGIYYGAVNVLQEPSGNGITIQGRDSQTTDLLRIRMGATPGAGNDALLVQNSGGVALTKLQADGGASFAQGNATIGSGGIIRGTQVSTNVDYSSLREENSGGLLRLTKQTAAAANPIANQAKIYLRDGTVPGTLKLVVRAGAAGAETTILDNIPQ